MLKKDHSHSAESALIWDREYTDPAFASLGSEPSRGFKDFLRFLKRTEKISLEGAHFFDSGCGVGKNSNYVAEEYGILACGYDVSKVSVEAAHARAHALGIEKNVQYTVAGFSDTSFWESLHDESFDIACDNMVLHLVPQKDRLGYVQNLVRILKPGGYLYIKTFALEGDAHAKYLVQTAPAHGEDYTYIHPILHSFEHVFAESELKSLFSECIFLKKQKVVGYQKWGNQSYKRQYHILYLKKI